MDMLRSTKRNSSIQRWITMKHQEHKLHTEARAALLKRISIILRIACIPFQVLQQSEEGHEVRVRQRAQKVHHAVFFGCWVWECCRGRRDFISSALLSLIKHRKKRSSHLCPPWRRGRGGRSAEALAAPWNTASVFLRWRWCPCRSASPECLWCLQVRQTDLKKIPEFMMMIWISDKILSSWKYFLKEKSNYDFHTTLVYWTARAANRYRENHMARQTLT